MQFLATMAYTQTVRTACPAQAWVVRRLTAWYLPRSRRRKTHVCIQKIFAFIRRCIRTGFCSPDLADFHDLYISSDEKLFNKILTCPNHILRTLLPPPTAQNYSLRNRPHNRQLPDRISRITDCNFTVRMLYRNMYWLLYILDLRFVLFLCTTAVWQFAINEVMLCYVDSWSTSTRTRAASCTSTGETCSVSTTSARVPTTTRCCSVASTLASPAGRSRQALRRIVSK